jgi:aspartyl-tRNA synthetase
MLDAPGELDPKQLEELQLRIDLRQENGQTE